MIDSKVVDKIRKLLALATSPNEHEAALAMEKAGELMARSGLCVADIENRQEAPSVHDETLQQAAKTKVRWKAGLMGHIANVFDCLAINTKSCGHWALRIVGMPSDVEMCKSLYGDLVRQIDLMAAKYDVSAAWHPRAERLAYRFGLVSGVGERLKKAYSAREEALRSNGDTMALVVMKKDVVTRYVKDNIRTVAARPVRITGSQSAYQAGMADSSRLRIHRAVSSR